ncbi:hypothetical protein [Flavobacterium sp. N2038]|uniref:hypothetical protein n=1 Tax=Flavobacterium sp. N2038 TaxID=2986829 RepID=UPI0022250236|nr:hypothetical protein [Flavobacterium sp. N2038]
MKKILVCLVVVFTISSCVMKEKMVINENGSGSFLYSFDLSGMFKMGFKSNDSIKKKQVLDTVFTFKEVFAKAKDSIAKLSDADKQKIKALEKFKVSVKSNEDKKQFEFSMEYNFPSTDSLKNMISPLEGLEAMPKLGPGKQLGALNAVPEEEKKKSRFTYNYDGKIFEKILIKGDIDKIKKENKKKEKEEENALGKQMDKVFKECKYSMEYHFPKRIKTISLKNAVISKDKKSFTLDIPIKELPDDEEKLGFKVLFEN